MYCRRERRKLPRARKCLFGRGFFRFGEAEAGDPSVLGIKYGGGESLARRKNVTSGNVGTALHDLIERLIARERFRISRTRAADGAVLQRRRLVNLTGCNVAEAGGCGSRIFVIQTNTGRIRLRPGPPGSG